MTHEQQQLVVKAMGLVRTACRRAGLQADEDAAAEGNMALCRAATSFDPAKGFKFSTYAYHAVVHALWDYQKKQRRHRCEVSGLHHDNGEYEELLDSMASTVPNSHELLVLRERAALSSASVSDEPGDMAGLARLTDRERLVLCMRNGIGHKLPHTLEAVGQHLGVSRERVRQIEAHALRRLRSRGRKVLQVKE